MDDADLTIDREVGRLVMKYRGLKRLDVNIFEFIDVKNIVHFDISYNNLSELPDQIEILRNLEVLNCSNNRLIALPSSIRYISLLRTLKAGGNQIVTLFDEIGCCSNLKFIDLSENLLETIPSSLSNCLRLRVIHLQNNRLMTLPYCLARLRGYGFLEDVNVTGNSRLDMIPEPVRDKAGVILWILSVLDGHATEIDYASRKVSEYDVLRKIQELKIIQRHEQLEHLLDMKNKLLTERDKVKWFLFALGVKEKCMDIFRTIASDISALFALRSKVNPQQFQGFSDE
jgi:Leucine-rich repeat (LRR) protein